MRKTQLSPKRLRPSLTDSGVKRRANVREGRLARDLGGRRQPASGAISGYKGDVVTPVFLIDSKATDKASIRVAKADLDKITGEANGLDREPALVLTFDAFRTNKEWAIIPIDAFRRLQEGT